MGPFVFFLGHYMADKKTPRVRLADVRHCVVGPYRDTAGCISAIAQFADDDPDGEAVVMRKTDFLQLLAAQEP